MYIALVHMHLTNCSGSRTLPMSFHIFIVDRVSRGDVKPESSETEFDVKVLLSKSGSGFNKSIALRHQLGDMK